MKNVLVSGYIGFNNFGDEAIFYALSNHLKTLGFNVSVLCANCSDVNKNYDVKTYYYKKPFEILKAILKNDILISGGGSLLQNKTSNFSLFYYLIVILLAKIFLKKVIIFAQGIEPILGKFPEFITKTILKHVDCITVRDAESKKLLSSWGIEALLVSDPAYSLVQDTEISNEKDGLIIQLRRFRGMDDKLVSALAEIIANNYQGKISVFSFQDEIDQKICIEFIEELKKYNVNATYISNKSISETIEIINNAKYIISTRLHGLIIANALKTSSVAIIYDEKIRTLVNELNLESIDIYNYTKDEIEKQLKNFFCGKSKCPYEFRRFDWSYIDKQLGK